MCGGMEVSWSGVRSSEELEERRGSVIKERIQEGVRGRECGVLEERGRGWGER